MKSLVIGALAGVIVSSAALAADPTGVWLSQDGDAKVHVTDCGGALCGSVVWLKEPIDPKTGRPRTDKFNPDTSKRERPMLGLPVVTGLRPSGANRWSGLIYNADEGTTHHINLTVTNPKQAIIVGCVLYVICQTERWTRTD